MKLFFFLLAVYARSGLAECVPVTAGKIFGRDLAAADSRYSALPETLVLGYAPSPGSQRMFGLAELDRIGRANGLAFHPSTEICFAFPMRRITNNEAMAAMRRALPPNADLRIV